MRAEAFAQSYDPTLTDRFGVWLSARQIRRWVPSFAGKRIADVGCGFHASFARTVLDQVAGAVLVDVAWPTISRRHPKVARLEGPIPAALAPLPTAAWTWCMMISVLEHLWEPLEALRELRRLLAPGGTCLINVPSWRGKRYLELAAFKLGLSARPPRWTTTRCTTTCADLWPLLVKAGFMPSQIACFSHKFGLNTFAACRVPPGPSEPSAAREGA